MRRVFGVLTLCLGLAGACVNQDDHTQIVVSVWSDLSIPNEISSIQVEVAGPHDTRSVPFELTTGIEAGKTKLPVVVVLVPPDNQDLAFEITASGYGRNSKGAIVSQAARLSFLPGESRLLSLFLGRACPTTIVCDDDHTCSNGTCDQPKDVNPQNLLPYSANVPLAPPDASSAPRFDSGSSAGAAEVGGPDTAMDARLPAVDSAPDTQLDIGIPSPDGGADVTAAGGAPGAGGMSGAGGAGGTGLTATSFGGATGLGGSGGSGGPNTGGAGGSTVPDAGVDVPPFRPDVGVDVAIAGCGQPGYSCCVSGNPCTLGGCCVANKCLANGVQCSTGGNCFQGSCVSPASLSLSGGPLDFGPVVVGQSSGVKSFTLTNVGAEPTAPIDVASQSKEFSISTGASGDCSGTALTANSSCLVRVVFTPSAIGDRSGSIVYSAGPGVGANALATGTGIMAADLEASQAFVVFGPAALGSSTGVTMRITNYGQAPSGLITLSSSNSTEFAIQADLGTDCSQVTPGLAAGASCNVRMSFTPSTTGSRSTTFTFSASPGGTVTLSGTGTGITPASLSTAATGVTFGSVTVGGPIGSPLGFTVTNYGQQQSGALSVISNSIDFFVVRDGVGDCLQGTDGGFGTFRLGADASCNVRVAFQPTAAGPRSGTVTVSASPGGTILMPVSGTGGSVGPRDGGTDAVAYDAPAAIQ